MGEWTEECCPRYMKPEYYDMVKSRVGRVNIKLGFLHNVLDRDYQDDLITKVREKEGKWMMNVIDRSVESCGRLLARTRCVLFSHVMQTT